MYNDLSDEEKRERNMQLKYQFKDIFITADTIIEKLKSVSITEENSEVLKHIISSLTDLKSYATFYLTNRYDNRSYIDNDSMFHKYLAILNGIKNVLKDVRSESCKDEEGGNE